MSDKKQAEIDRLQWALQQAQADRDGWEAKHAIATAEIERLRAALEARGPYCAQHGELQPCSQHRWAFGNDKDWCD